MPAAPKKKAPTRKKKAPSTSKKKAVESVEVKKTTKKTEEKKKPAEDDLKKKDETPKEEEAVFEEQEQADITSIYELDEGEPIDMTTMEQKRGRGKWIVGGVIVTLLVAAAGYFGYQVYNQDFGNQNGEVELTLSVDEKVASGDVVTIEVEYQNNQRVDITSGEVELFYPDGFRFQSASVDADDDKNKVWSLDNVRPGTGGRIRVVGQIVGEKDEEKEFSALLTYRPQNFSQDFQESVSDSVTITSSIIDLEVDAPQQLQSDSEMTYTVTFTNTSKVALDNVKAVMEYPETFTFTSTSRDPDREDNEWRYETLGAGESETLEITGTLSGKSGKTKEFTFKFGVVEIDNSFNVQVEKTSLVVIVNPELELTITAPEIADPETEVPVTVTVSNTSEVDITDLDITLNLGPAFKKETHTFKTIEELTPFQEEELQFNAELRKAGKSSGTHTVTASVESATVEGNEVDFSTTAETDVKVRGDLAITTEGRYYDADLTKIGSGPLPPIVNNETTYVIQWTVLNGANALSDFSMTATLPETVLWANEASNGVTYNKSTRQISYSTDSVPAGQELDIQFQVTVVPTNDDLNKLLVLTGETIIEAQDDVTGEAVSETRDRITSDLPNDEGASGKGVVEGS